MSEKELLLINIAGFASDGKNKSGQLKKMFPDAKVVNIITSGIYPDEVIVKILTEKATDRDSFAIIIGSSLGGYYAHLASIKLDCPSILINPSMKPWKTLKDSVGINSFFNGDTFKLTKRHLSRMEEIVNLMEKTVGLYDEIDDPPYALFTGSMDEKLDHTVTRSLLQFPNIDCTVGGYDHRFEDISIIKSAIELLANYKVAIEDDSFSPHDPFGDDED